MKRPLSLAVLFVVSAALVGCATGPSATPVTEAPLESDKQEDLQRTLIGSWGLEYTTPTPSRQQRKDPGSSKIKWTFNADGTGRSLQKLADDVPMVGGQEQRATFNWELDGRNLVLSGDGEKTYFRVEEWSDDHMMFFNYAESNYFILYPFE